MYLNLAWRNIWRNKRRTVITLSSIGFAVFFACIMQSMQEGSYERMIDNAVRFNTGHIQIHADGYWQEKIIDNSIEWTAALADRATASEEVEAIAPRLESFALAATGSQTKGVMVVGIDPAKEEAITGLSSKVSAGTYLTGHTAGALVGKDLATFLKIDVGDTLVLIGQGYHGVNAAGKFPVAGIVKFPNPQFNQQAVFLTLKDAQYFYGADGRITSLSILLKDAGALKEVNEQLQAGLDAEAYEVMRWDEMMPELVQSIELDYYGGLIMIFILYLVIAFGIFGTFMMMAKERTYEFGVLVAIGMRKIKLQLMVILEILILTFLGVAAGIVAALPFLIYLFYNPILMRGDMAKTFENFGMEPIMPFSLDPGIFLSQGLVILVIAILLGIYPMVAIHSLKIIKALKE